MILPSWNYYCTVDYKYYSCIRDLSQYYRERCRTVDPKMSALIGLGSYSEYGTVRDAHTVNQREGRDQTAGFFDGE